MRVKIQILSVDGSSITYWVQSHRQLIIDEHNLDSPSGNNEVIKFRKYFIETYSLENNLDIFLRGSLSWLRKSQDSAKVIVEYIVKELHSGLLNLNPNLTKIMTVKIVKSTWGGKKNERYLEPTINGRFLHSLLKDETMLALIKNLSVVSK